MKPEPRRYALNAAQQQLVIDNLPLVTYTMNKYFEIRGDEWDDIQSIGTIGLLKAACTYLDDVDGKHYAFNTYAVACIRFQIIHHCKYISRKCRKPPKPLLSLNYKIMSQEYGDVYELIDLVRDEKADVERDAMRDLTRDSILDIVRDNAPTCYQVFILGRRQRDIAKEIHRSRQCVNQKMTMEMRKLRSKLKHVV